MAIGLKEEKGQGGQAGFAVLLKGDRKAVGISEPIFKGVFRKKEGSGAYEGLPILLFVLIQKGLFISLLEDSNSS